MALFTTGTPTAITNGGNNAGVNVLRVGFHQAALAGAPILEAYSTGSAGVAPTLNAPAGNADTTFSSTPDDSCITAVPTGWEGVGGANDTVSNDPGANWASKVGGANEEALGTGYVAVGRRLVGTLSTLQLTDDALVSSWNLGSMCTFNVSYRLGVNSLENPGDNTHVLACRYIYTGGTDPLVTWQANEGTEGTPVWGDLAGYDISGAAIVAPRKVIHANAGAAPANPVITKPTSGKSFSGSLVVQEV
jgi:hypothetical protein